MRRNPSIDMKKNYGGKHDRFHEVPASTETLLDLTASFRKSIPVVELNDDVMDQIRDATVGTHKPYSLDDIPEIEKVPARRR